MSSTAKEREAAASATEVTRILTNLQKVADESVLTPPQSISLLSEMRKCIELRAYLDGTLAQPGGGGSNEHQQHQQ